jgi:hypothetical protein
MANHPVINGFNAGELSPYIGARRDIQKYSSGCLLLENCQVLPYGGVTRRPALNFRAVSRQNYRPRLVPFTFSSEDSIMLELTDKEAYDDPRPPWTNPRHYNMRFLLITTDVRVVGINRIERNLSETVDLSVSSRRCFLLNSTDRPNECSRAGVGISGVSLIEVPKKLVCLEIPQSLGGEIRIDGEIPSASAGITDIELVEFRFLDEDFDETGTPTSTVEDIDLEQITMISDSLDDDQDMTMACTDIELIQIDPQEL